MLCCFFTSAIRWTSIQDRYGGRQLNTIMLLFQKQLHFCFPLHLNVELEKKKLFQLTVSFRTVAPSCHSLNIPYISANHLAAVGAFAAQGECNLQTTSTNTICIKVRNEWYFSIVEELQDHQNIYLFIYLLAFFHCLFLSTAQQAQRLRAQSITLQAPVWLHRMRCAETVKSFCEQFKGTNSRAQATSWSQEPKLPYSDKS